MNHAGELFRGLSDARKQNKEKRAKEDAAVEVVGERFQICMEAATSDGQKKDCHDAMLSPVSSMFPLFAGSQNSTQTCGLSLPYWLT